VASANLLKVGIFVFCIGLVGCERQVSFSSDVQPIFDAHCIECHDQSAEGSATSGFSLGNYDSVMKGTNFGPVIVAGNSLSSALYLVIAHKTDPQIHMPPHHKDAWAIGRGAPLSEDQVKTIRTWIDQGAINN